MNQTEALEHIASWQKRHSWHESGRLPASSIRWCIHALTGQGYPTARAKVDQHFALCHINGRDPWAAATFKMPSATLNQVLGAVCRACGVNRGEVLGKSRIRQIVRARRIAIYFVRDVLKESLRTTADFFNMAQHGSVIHHVKTLKKQMREDESLCAFIASIEVKCIDSLEDAENE